jgi:CRISPR-associated protein Cas5h
MFRRLYTTTSPHTYPIPTGTVISGLLASILGMNYKEYYNEYLGSVFNSSHSEYAIQILNPIKYIRINENWIETKKFSFKRMLKIATNPTRKDTQSYERMQASLYMLREPKYRLFISLPEIKYKGNNIMDMLKTSLESQEPYYIPYLGVSECIANIKFEDDIKVEQETFKEDIEVNTVLSIEKILGLFQVNKSRDLSLTIGREIIPRDMDSDRRVTKYVKVIYEMKGRSIPLKGTIGYHSDKYGIFTTF